MKLTLFSINGGVDGGERGPQTSSRVDIIETILTFNGKKLSF
jgi:hypothetical protein